MSIVNKIVDAHPIGTFKLENGESVTIFRGDDGTLFGVDTSYLEQMEDDENLLSMYHTETEWNLVDC